MYTKSGEKEFLKLYIGLSSCHLTTTGRPALKRTMYDFKNSFFFDFLLIQRAKYIFSRDMFCLYHFWTKINSVLCVSVVECVVVLVLVLLRLTLLLFFNFDGKFLNLQIYWRKK